MPEPGQSAPVIRRLVTGHDNGGVAKVLQDGPASNVKFPSAGVVTTLIWCSDKTPADIAVGEQVEDMGARNLGSPPPENGSRFVVIEFSPGSPAVMHRTETLDYVIVLSGEIDMDTDAGSVKMKAGDVMVQRGTNHAWANRGTTPARVAFVLLDAKPLGIGKPILRGAQVK
jgi:quercetin dioxygenase-like cupin family protein